LGTALVADPEPDFPLVFEGEAAQVAETARKYVLGIVPQPPDDWIFDPRPAVGKEFNCRF
jgi:hypothetical protein